MRMNIRHNLNIVGEHFFDNSGLEFVVTRESGRSERGDMLYDIKYVKSGYINKNRRRIEIRSGEVKDRLAPVISGVACIGDVIIPNCKCIERKIYETWKNMIYRCYNPKCYSYKNYGAKGITVCKEWLRFDVFLQDAKMLNGYDEELIMNRTLELDKDIIDRSAKQYNKHTCQWVLVSENRSEAGKHRWNQYRMQQ